MAGSVGGATSDSWKAADLDAAMSKLIISKPNNDESSSNSTAASPAPSTSSSGGVLEDSVDSVDQFLREALQNPRERLSVLRMEQDVEKFIRDPSQQQMEFNQLPTSYLRLAAHRVAQHYSLQSMVLMDNNLSDSSASRIIVCKTSECRQPLIRLADIPVNLPTEDPNSSVVRVSIKQRPDKRSQVAGGADSNSSSNSLKSMEERKEDYSRARARIFSSSSSRVVSKGTQESGPRMVEALQHGSLGTPKVEDNSVPRAYVNIGRGSADSLTGSSKSGRGRMEKEPTSRSRSNSRVAIFRDHEVERKDPDYNRSYGRYVQSSDPGYGFNGGSYPIRPFYAPVLSYNTQILQQGSAHRSPISAENPLQTLPQHLPGPWVAPSLPVGVGYGPPEAMMTVFGPNHAAPHSASTLYMHYPYQQPGMTFIHPYQQVHQHFAQSLQPGASFGLARPQ